MLKKLPKYHLFFFTFAIVYFLSRLTNLTLQPIFADEAIYIHWAQIILNDPSQLFISLTDGKTPLFMWLQIPLLNIFPDPLFAGRFLTVIAGFFGLIAVYLICRDFINQKVAFIASILMLITPYIFFFDRMALVDTLLSTLTIWSIYLTFHLIKKPNMKLSIILGLVLAASIYTKTPGMFNLIGATLTSIVLTFKKVLKTKNYKSLYPLVFAPFLAFIIFNFLRISPSFYTLQSRDKDYLFTLSKIQINPIDPLFPHLKDLYDWFPDFLTPPIFYLAIFAIFYTLFKRQLYLLLILLWIAIPLTFSLFFLQTFTTRYVLYTIPPLLIAVSFTLEDLTKYLKKLQLPILIVLLLLLSLLPLKFDYLLLTSPYQASIPKESKRGYFEDWTAGYGLKEIASYLKDQSKDQQVIVITPESFGTLPNGLAIYIKDIRSIYLLSGSSAVEELDNWANSHKTFLVTNKSRLPNKPNLQLINQYPKPKNANFPQEAIQLYLVKPQI